MQLNRSTYFAFFFLFCFLASFSASTYKNVNTVSSKSKLKNSKTIFVSTKEGNEDATNDFLFEENEGGTENNFESQFFTLPFFITYFQYEFFQPKLIPAKPLSEKLTNPIYIAVCNFRI